MTHKNWKEVTIRASGKCHPAVEMFGQDGRSQGYMVLCSCPGSKNGQLANSARKVAEGHEKANCRI